LSDSLNRCEPKRLADEIEDRPVKVLFERFVETYTNVHDEIRAQETNVEIRFFYKDDFLCRVAPYRELFHVQVGDGPIWETRVRTEASFRDTVDRALQRFLQVYAAHAG
jgi:hypothetical protein